MNRLMTLAFAVVVASAGRLPAQGQVQRGKLVKVDADKGLVTLSVDGKELTAYVTPDTKLQNGMGQDLKDRLRDKAFAEGAMVQFIVMKREDKLFLFGMRPATGPQGQPPEKVDLSGFKPLTELGTGKHKDFTGGLYPDGKNERPAAHEAAGLALAKQVQPLDDKGKPADDGKIVLLSIGMSNTTQAFSTFQRLAKGAPGINPRVVLVDGAQGGQTAARIQNTDGSGKAFWDKVDERLNLAGATRAQVQAVWIKEADAGPTDPFPGHAKTLQKELVNVVHILHDRFPNLKLVYLSSRTFGGYATTRLNPEPFAYETGFAVKWLIEQQLKGDPELNWDAAKGEKKAPWLSWGPYLWANGTTKRTDGFFYDREDFGNDGTHPTRSGQEKVAKLLLDFFMTDSTAKPWFAAK
jgi:hypothetical protein